MPGICTCMPVPTAVLVTVTWFCMCILHMLCQMAENEGVEFAGEAGVFPSLLPDNTPSGVGELLPRLPANWGTNTRREDDRKKWDGMGIGE